MGEKEIKDTSVKNFAEYIGMSRAGVYLMKKDHPRRFNLMWNGWLEMCKK